MAFQISELHKKHDKAFVESITHPLTNEICQGTLSDEKLFVYLRQDLMFFESGLRVMGKTLSLCRKSESLVTLAKQIGVFANDENDYFTICLKELRAGPLSVPTSMIEGNEVIKEVKEYIDYMETFFEGDVTYVEIITFIYTMEKIYLEWARYNLQNGIVLESLPFKFSEWIRLHSDESFISWVNYLEKEVERSVQSPDNEALCEKVFVQTIRQEINFFQGCYSYNSIQER